MRSNLDQVPLTGWYPGHMLKANRRMREYLQNMDLVVQLVDARLPMTSNLPEFQELLGNKPVTLVFTKFDLADASVTMAWVKHYREKGYQTYYTDNQSRKSLRKIMTGIREFRDAHKVNRETGQTFPFRIMVAGLPNVGKSTFVNAFAGAKKTKTGTLPTVTRGEQWVRVNADVEILDTPGVLWPNIQDKRTELKLALAGTMKDEIVGVELEAAFLWEWARENNVTLDLTRYGLDELPKDPDTLIEIIGRRRGFLLSGEHIDYEKSATALIKDFREGRLGRFTLDPSPTDNRLTTD